MDKSTQSNLYQKIGSNITHYRTKKNLSQDELATVMGVTRVTISHLEKGSNSMTIDRILQLSEVLDITYNNLLEEDHRHEKKLPKRCCFKCGHYESGSSLCSNLGIVTPHKFYCKNFKIGEL